MLLAYKWSEGFIIPSEYITRQKVAAAAGLVTLSVTLPWAAGAKIKSITIGCTVATQFVRVKAFLVKEAATAQLIGFKWMANLNQIGGWTGLNVDWPPEYVLYIILSAQAACGLYYTIEYERFTEAEAKKRWGEA